MMNTIVAEQEEEMAKHSAYVLFPRYKDSGRRVE